MLLKKILKPKACASKICKIIFEPTRGLQKVCSPKCALDYTRQKEHEKAARIERAANREKKISLQPLGWYEERAKKEFQKWVRNRDAKLPCISCDNKTPADWCGSHYFDAGQYSGLIFDERNCHGACNTYCNKHLSGNKINYRKGLVKRYGLAYVEQLESEADSKRNYKYTRDELEAIRIKYRDLNKEIIKKLYTINNTN